MATDPDLNVIMELAHHAAIAAGDASMPFFRGDHGATEKADGSLVTRADKAAEDAILAHIRSEFPDHAILAEESGALVGADAKSRWIIDPLDGTNRFARGFLFWGPLIAFEHRGEILAGAMALPAIGEVYWAARGLGCHSTHGVCRVSPETNWTRANLSLGAIPRLLESPVADGVVELCESASYVAAGGDLNGCALVLRGQAEAWIEYGVQTWDIAPFRIMIEEAGGVFSDLQGGKSVETGAAVATNAALAVHVRRALGF